MRTLAITSSPCNTWKGSRWPIGCTASRDCRWRKRSGCVEQYLAGLDAAHRAGLIHRDIKPANVLLDAATGRAVLVDFGLVRRMGEAERLTATGVIMGTVNYIAPEQARGHQVNGRADLYAVGVLLYQMLAGRLPFEADTPTAMIFQHAYEEPCPLKEVAHRRAAADCNDRGAARSSRIRKTDIRAHRQVLDDLKAFGEGRPVEAGRAEPAEEWPAAGLPPEPELLTRAADLVEEGPWRRAAIGRQPCSEGMLPNAFRSFKAPRSKSIRPSGTMSAAAGV